MFGKEGAWGGTSNIFRNNDTQKMTLMKIFITADDITMHAYVAKTSWS